MNLTGGVNYNVPIKDLGDVSGVTDVSMLGYTFFKCNLIGVFTPNITNVVLRTPICFSEITGEFTFAEPTSSGVTFKLVPNTDTYTSGLSRLWIIFNTATQADYFFKNIE